MTTYPALALLGKLDARTVAAALGGSLLFAGVARAIWMASIRRYTSASS
jgi:ABC-2 type transport system permease protein